MGFSVDGPGSLDTLIILSVQLIRNAWEGDLALGKICDLHELLRVESALDWKTLSIEAKELHIEWMVSLSFSVVSMLFGIPQPPFHAKRPIPRALIDSIARLIVEQTSREALTKHDLATEERIHWLVRERFRDKIWPQVLRPLLLLTKPPSLRRLARSCFYALARHHMHRV
jgi:hypothetical protein